VGFIPSNMTTWPLVTDGTAPAALGDSQLQYAWLAGMNRVWAAGTWRSLFAGDPLLAPYDAMMGPSSQFPFPSGPSGVLSTILTRRSITVGYPVNFVLQSPGGTIVLMNGTTTPPTGAYYTLTEAVVGAIATAYGTTLTITYAPYPNSDAILADMLAGRVDVTTSSLAVGALYRGVARSFQFTPTMGLAAGGAIPLWVPTSSPYNSLAELVAAVRAGTARVVATGNPAATVATNFFQATVAAAPTSDASFAGMADGTYQAVWDSSPPAAQAGTARVLAYPMSRVVSTLFRPPTLPPTPTPTPAATTPSTTSGDVDSVTRGAVTALAIVAVLCAAAVVIIGMLFCRSASRARLHGGARGSGVGASGAGEGARAVANPLAGGSTSGGGGGGIAVVEFK